MPSEAVTLTVPLAAWADSGDSTDGLKATGSELSAQKKAKKKKKKEAKDLNPLDIGDTLEYFRDELKDDAKEIKKIRQAEQLYKRIRIHVPVEIIPIETARAKISRQSRKPVRFFDLRTP